MSVDALNFRKALGSFTTGVTVVTTKGDQGDVGLTANSFNSVSLDPPMILWSLAKSAHSLSAFKNAQHFSVHILSADQESISNQFAKGGADKFSGVDLERGPDDVPLLKHCAARFVCKTAYQYEGGDHIIFVGQVLDFSHWDKLPLLFHSGKYGQILKNGSAIKNVENPQFDEYTLGSLLRISVQQIFRPLKVELTKRALNLSQYFFLALVGRQGHAKLTDLIQMLEPGDNVPRADEIKELVLRGLIEQSEGSVSLTASGSKLHVELASLYKNSESELLKSLDFEMRQTISLSLLEIIEKTKISPNT